MLNMTIEQKTEFSHGFDRGNYGNAYESQDWESWSERQGEQSEVYRQGMLLGFFSSYEIDEISDELIAGEVAYLRDIYGDDV